MGGDSSRHDQLVRQIIDDVVRHPELAGDPEWESVAVHAEVSDGSVRVVSYRYRAGGPPVSGNYLTAPMLFADLRAADLATTGEQWRLAVVRFDRRSGRVATEFLAGDEATGWEWNPVVADDLAERLRPSPADFGLAPEPPADADPAGDPLTVECRADGGVVVADGAGAVARLETLTVATRAVAAATRASRPITLVGHLDSPDVAEVVAALEAAGTITHRAASEPNPFTGGSTSLDVAVLAGRGDVVGDLLRRGARRGRSDRALWRYANDHGHVGVLLALQDAGMRAPLTTRRPPEILKGGVVIQAPVPRAMWVCAAAMVALGTFLAVVLRDVVALLIFLAPTLVLLGIVVAAMRNTAVAIRGGLVSRRSGLRWQSNVLVNELAALGYAPDAQARVRAFWALGNRQGIGSGYPTVRRAFDVDLDATMPDARLRYVTLYASRGFGSPGLEAYLRATVDPGLLVAVGSLAQQRVWPDGRALS